MVLARPELFDALMSGLSVSDPLVRMRCADAAEKVSVLHPEYLQPYKRALVEDFSRIEQQEVHWHVAVMLARLPLTGTEQRHVIDILLSYTSDRSSLVKTFAMQALADLAMRDEKVRPRVVRHLKKLCVIGTPAMRARGRRLLSSFQKRGRA